MKAKEKKNEKWDCFEVIALYGDLVSEGLWQIASTLSFLHVVHKAVVMAKFSGSSVPLLITAVSGHFCYVRW